MDSFDKIKIDYLDGDLNIVRMIVRLEYLVTGKSLLEPKLSNSIDESNDYFASRTKDMFDPIERAWRRDLYRTYFDIVDYSEVSPQDFDFPFDAHPQLNFHVYLSGNFVRRCQRSSTMVTLDEDIAERPELYKYPTKGFRLKILNGG